jgi:hypothetical protein
MNRRDQELLDKQLWGISPRLPHKGGLVGLTILVVFFAGLATGDVLSARANMRLQVTSADVTTIGLDANSRKYSSIGFVLPK